MRIQTFLFLSTVLVATSAQAQQNSSPDTMSSVRRLFQTDVYLNNVKLSKRRFSLNLVKSKKWANKNQWANLMQIAGPLISAGGVGLAVDAIKGQKMYTNIDGQTYPYVKRDLLGLLSGVTLFAGGLCLNQWANDIKMDAAAWFNSQTKKDFEKKQTSFNLKMGISPDGRIGLIANF